MTSITKVSKYLIFAIFIWITDSLILSLLGSIPFEYALWSGASQMRLLVRLCIIFTLLIVGFTLILKQEIDYIKVLRMNESDRSALYGTPNSPLKSRRLLYYALQLAVLMKMDHIEQEKLRKLCYCYDLGLIGVPIDIINKNGNFNENEIKIWNKHIDLGAQIANNIPQFNQIAPLIATHEEKYDGSGFQSMYGKSIPLSCRIFSVVFMFDYFTQLKYNNHPMEIDEALNELDMYTGNVLDPEVMEAFHSLFSNQHLAAKISIQVYIQ